MPWDFPAELLRLGPGRCDRPVSLAAARRYCAGVVRSRPENFAVASVLLPRPLLPHFHAVYAYCRWADDLADETAGGPHTLALLDWWRGELLACYDGRPRHPVMVALADTVRRFGIPPAPFLDLLTAFEQDQRVTEYATFDQLLGYCRRSADPVGRLVLYLLGCFSEERAALADETCTGLQLANFWQDVGRDLDKGRVYLPTEDRTRFGYPDADLRARRYTPAFAELLRFQMARTREFFARGDALISRLPRRGRAEVGLFAAGGRATLDAIERRGYDVWARRPTVPAWRKAGLMVRAAFGGAFS